MRRWVCSKRRQPKLCSDRGTGVNEIVTLNPVNGMLSVRSVAVKVLFGGRIGHRERRHSGRIGGRSRRRLGRVDGHGDKGTALPLSGNPLASFRTTSTMALERPSAGTVVLLATMSESGITGTVVGVSRR